MFIKIRCELSAVGAVVSKEGTTGTGCLIGPNIVLTCAHNCYHQQKGHPLTEISFIPSLIKKYVPEFTGFKAKKIYYLKQYEGAAKDIFSAVCYDYAVLILDYQFPGCDMFNEQRNFQFYFGSLGYDFDWEANDSQKQKILRNMQLYGYPSNTNQLTLYFGDAFIDKYCFLYKFRTLPGTSGGSVIQSYSQNKQDKYWIRAIHQRDSSKIVSETRAALKLNMKMYQDICSNLRRQYILYTYNLSYSQLTKVKCKYPQRISYNWSKLTYKNFSLLKQVNEGDKKELKKCFHTKKIGQIISQISAIEDENKNQPHRIALDLWNNNIETRGDQHLRNAKQNHLKGLNFIDNHIKAVECSHLVKGQWDNIKGFDCKNINTDSMGCESLARAKWDNFLQLDLGNNNISDVGCEHIAKAKWDNLKGLYLELNNIGALGCAYLSNARWESLQQIRLNENPIGKEGYECFSKRPWKIYCDLKFKQ